MQLLQSLLPYSACEVSRCFTSRQTLGGAVRLTAPAGRAADECTVSHLEADSRRRCGRNCMQLLQCLLALGTDVLQHTSLPLPLEVIVHHLVQGLVVIAIIHVALQACELPAVG